MRLFNKPGKVGLKQIIVTLVIIIFCLMAGCQNPFIAHYAHDKIKIGMTGSQVKRVLNGLGKYYSYCDANNGRVLYEDKCGELILSMSNQSEIHSLKMTITFMGPVFTKNDFSIIFGNEGKVQEITPVKSWD